MEHNDMFKKILFLVFIGFAFGSVWLIYDAVNPHRNLIEEMVLEETGEEIEALPDGTPQLEENKLHGKQEISVKKQPTSSLPHSDALQASTRTNNPVPNSTRPNTAIKIKSTISSVTIAATTNHSLHYASDLQSFRNPADLIAHHGFASGLYDHGSRIDVIPCDLAKSARFIAGGVEVDSTQAKESRLDFYQTDATRVALRPGKTYRITYDYTVVKSVDKVVEFYHYLAGAADHKKVLGFQMSIDQVGASGHNKMAIRINSNSAYAFVLGVKSKCVLRISNLKITELE